MNTNSFLWFLIQLVGITLTLFVSLLGMLELGRRAYYRRQAADPDGQTRGLGAVEGAIFTLLGLLLAFSFSGAAGRFNDRKWLVGEEANEISTAWLRIELLPVEDRAPLQALFRAYTDARIASYTFERADPRTEEAQAKTTRLQQEIWSMAVASCPTAQSASACTLLLGSINNMLDITTTRLVATWIHPPAPVYGMLFGLALTAALLTGYGMAPNADRNWLHRVMFAGGITVAIFVTLDLEFPRIGLIRMDEVDQLLVDVRQSFDR